jgi:WD40 repeat protein/energy-coupling factor transporter ATP-binding protein EcfA2
MNPFPGLRPYEQSDAANFFGREAQINDLVRLLKAERFVAVSGVSGCGKSSLVRAGLIPALNKGLLPIDQQRWRVAEMTPGAGPIQNLAAELARLKLLLPRAEGENVGSASSPALAAEESPFPHIETLFAKGSSGASTELAPSLDLAMEILKSVVPAPTARSTATETGTGPTDEPEPTHTAESLVQDLGVGGSALVQVVAPSQSPGSNFALLLLVDQFEEIFRYARETDPREVSTFIDLLVETVQQRAVPIYVVLTMRTDFLGECARFRGLPELINRSQYLVPRMTRAELTTSIQRPAEMQGTTLTLRLVDRLLNETGENPERLPLLQHALNRTWKAWEDSKEGGAIDLPSYLKAGTIDGEGNPPQGALSLHAQGLFGALDPEYQAAARVLFRCVAERSRGGRDARRPCRLTVIARVAFAPAAAAPDWSPSAAHLTLLRKAIEVFRAPGSSFLRPPPPEELTPESLIDISHESLIRGWGTLRDWVTEEIRAGNDWVWLLEMERRQREQNGNWLRGAEIATADKLTVRNPFNRFWVELISSENKDPEAYDRVLTFIELSKAEEERLRLENLDRDLEERNREEITRVALLGSEQARRDAQQAREEAESLQAQAQSSRQKMKRFAFFGVMAIVAAVVVVAGMVVFATVQGVKAANKVAAAFLQVQAATETSRQAKQKEERAVEKQKKAEAATKAAEEQTLAAWKEAEQARVAREEANAALGSLRSSSANNDREAAANLAKAFTLMTTLDADLIARFQTAYTKAASWSAPLISEELVKQNQEFLNALRRSPELRQHAERLYRGAAAAVELQQNRLRAALGTSGRRTAPAGDDPVKLSEELNTSLTGLGALSQMMDDLGIGEESWRNEVRDRLASWTAGASETQSKLAQLTSSPTAVDPPAAAPVRSRPEAMAIPQMGKVTDLAFQPGGAAQELMLVTAAADKKVMVWKVGESSIDRVPVIKVRSLAVTELAFSPNGRQFAAATEDNGVQILSWDGDARSIETTSYTAHKGIVTHVAFSPQGTLIASAGEDRTVRVFEAESRKTRLISSPPFRDMAQSVRFAHNSENSLVASCSDDGRVRIHDYKRLGLLWDYDIGAPSRYAEFSADDQWVVGVGADNYIKVWSTWNSGKNFQYPDPSAKMPIWHAAFRPIPESGSRTFLVASAWDDGSVRLWDFTKSSPEEGVVPLEPRHEGKVARVEWSANGRWLASSGKDGKVFVWDFKNAQKPACVLQLDGEAGEIRRLAFSPDSRFIAHATGQSGALVWNISDVTQSRDLKVSYFYYGDAYVAAKEKLIALVENAGFTTRGTQSLQTVPPDTLEVRYFRYPEDQAKASELLALVHKALPNLKARISYVKSKGELPKADFEIWFGKEVPSSPAASF